MKNGKVISESWALKMFTTIIDYFDKNNKSHSLQEVTILSKPNPLQGVATLTWHYYLSSILDLILEHEQMLINNVQIFPSVTNEHLKFMSLLQSLN